MNILALLPLWSANFWLPSTNPEPLYAGLYETADFFLLPSGLLETLHLFQTLGPIPIRIGTPTPVEGRYFLYQPTTLSMIDHFLIPSTPLRNEFIGVLARAAC
jgi:hypothetical protein